MYRNLYIIGLGCCLCTALFFVTFTGDARPRADYVWNNATEPQSLDPGRITGHPEGALALALFEGLTTYHPVTLEPVPAVARSWELDGLSYTFHLREDSRWVRGAELFEAAAKGGSDQGSTVTAHDFVYTWQRHSFPETGSEYSYLFHIIEGYEEYQEAVQDEWKEVVGRYGTSRPDHNVVRPADLTPEDQEEVHGFREETWRRMVQVRAVDDFTLRVTLRAAAPYFTTLTSFFAFLPVPRAIVEKHGDAWVLPHNIVTNGPYYLETWRFNAYIRLRKNLHHWETRRYAAARLAELQALPLTPVLRRERDLLKRLGSFEEGGLDILEALAVEEQNTSLNLYLNGDVDRIRELPSNIVGDLLEASRRPPGLPHLHHGAQLAVYFYNVNLEHPALQGESGWKLRRALALAVDRVGLVETVTRQGQAPAFGMVPPGVPGYDQRPLLGSGDFATDQAEARRLAEEVRAERGELPRLKILYNTSENHAKIAAFIQAAWRETVGLQCELNNQEWGVFLESRHTGNFDISRMGWYGDYPDANTFLDLYTSENPNNDPKYKNPFYDRLVLKYAARIDQVLRDPERREEMVRDLRRHPLWSEATRETAGRNPLLEAVEAFDAAPEADKPEAAFRVRGLVLQFAEAVLIHDVAIIPLYFYTSAQLWSPQLDGIHMNLLDQHPMRFLRWKEGHRPRHTRYDDFPRLRAGGSPVD